MEKEKTYRRTKFSEDVIRSAAELIRHLTPLSEPVREMKTLQVQAGDSIWKLDTEAEFFSEYRRSTADYQYILWRGDHRVALRGNFNLSATVTVSAPTRSDIESVFAVFEQARQRCQLADLPKSAPDLIFIGHGRSPMWRDLKDHLHEKHNYQVAAYELGARAGHSIRDILENMLENSALAFLVMTAEDEMGNGTLHTRQNVVHEAGLFQGRLGFRRAVMLVEHGVEVFSNIQGIEQIRFSPGAIKETFGDVVATIRRELHGEATQTLFKEPAR